MASVFTNVSDERVEEWIHSVVADEVKLTAQLIDDIHSKILAWAFQFRRADQPLHYLTYEGENDRIVLTADNRSEQYRTVSFYLPAFFEG